MGVSFQVPEPATDRVSPSGPVQLVKPAWPPSTFATPAGARPVPTTVDNFRVDDAQLSVVLVVVSTKVTCGEAPCVVAVAWTLTPVAAVPALTL